MKYALIIILLFHVSPVIADWDTGSSHNFFYRTPLDSQRYFVGRGNVATRNGLDLFFGYIDANIGFKLNKNWSSEIGYRHAALELSSGWREEYRPHLNLAYRGQFKDWAIRNRHRVELRFFEGNSNDHIRYRNETVLSALNTYTQLKLTPFVSEELFFEFTDSHLNVNWLTLGVSHAVSKNQKLKLGYRWQAQKFSGDWSHRHVLVLGYSVINF